MQTRKLQTTTDLPSDIAFAIPRCEADGHEETQPRIWAGAFVGLSDMLQEQGVDYEAILAEAGLTPEMLQEHTTLIPMDAYVKVFDLAARQTGDPLLALHFGERYAPSHNSVLFYAYLNAPTLKSAIEVAVRYVRLVARMSSSFSVHDGVGCYEFSCQPRQANFMHMDCVQLTRWLRLFRNVLGEDWKPLSVGFVHNKPDDISEYVRLFGENIEFDQPGVVRCIAVLLRTASRRVRPKRRSAAQNQDLHRQQPVGWSAFSGRCSDRRRIHHP